MFEAFANALAYGMLGLDPSSRTGAALHFFIMDVAKIFVLLVVATAILSVFPQIALWLPSTMMSR